MQGEMHSALLESGSSGHDHERGCTRHLINESNSGFMIKLGHPSIINYIKMQLWDKDLRYNNKYIFYIIKTLLIYMLFVNKVLFLLH